MIRPIQESNAKKSAAVKIKQVLVWAKRGAPKSLVHINHQSKQDKCLARQRQ